MSILFSTNGVIVGGNGRIRRGGEFTHSDIVSGAITIPTGNSISKITLTSVSTLTVRANIDLPNFALEIDNTSNSNDVTITVTSNDGLTTLYKSAAGGNKVSKNKYVQLTCVGNCWTLAEFEIPSA